MAKRTRKQTPNKGGHHLARLSIPQSELAVTFGVSQPCLAQWAKGVTKPSAPKRQIGLDHFQIGLAEWDEPLDAPASKPKNALRVLPAPTPEPDAPDAAPAGEPENLLGKAASMEAFVVEQMARIQTDALTPKEKIDVTAKCVTVLAQLGKITGEGEVTTKKILASVFFRQIIDRIAEATRDHPEVAGKIAVALRRLEGA